MSFNDLAKERHSYRGLSPMPEDQENIDAIIETGPLPSAACSNQLCKWVVRATFCGCMIFAYLGYWLGYSSDHDVCLAMRNNTVLAYLPVEMSLHLSANRKTSVFWLLFALWAIFFPNAPYVLTDYFHLARVDPYIILASGKRTSLVRPESGLWLTFTVVSVSAIACTLFGTWSLDRVAGMLQRRLKRTGPMWRFAFVACFATLASVGIYLGRFPRLNSVDLLMRPGHAIGQLASSVGMNMLEFTIMLTLVQVLVWGCMRFFLAASKAES